MSRSRPTPSECELIRIVFRQELWGLVNPGFSSSSVSPRVWDGKGVDRCLNTICGKRSIMIRPTITIRPRVSHIEPFSAIRSRNEGDGAKSFIMMVFEVDTICKSARHNAVLVASLLRLSVVCNISRYVAILDSCMIACCPCVASPRQTPKTRRTLLDHGMYLEPRTQSSLEYVHQMLS